MSKLLSLVTLIFMTAAISACSAFHSFERNNTRSGKPAREFDLKKSLDEAQRDADKLLGREGRTHRAAWDQVEQGKTWTEVTLKIYRENQSVFDSPTDINEFCPGFASATQYQKETCWLRIISAMAFYESGHDPNETYKEHTGTTSVGLLMMNPEHCSAAPTIAALKNAELNLTCALTKMRFFLRRDQLISGDEKGKRGAASYWSVLRDIYFFQDLVLGKKPHIFLYTRTYMNYQEPPAAPTPATPPSGGPR